MRGFANINFDRHNNLENAGVIIESNDLITFGKTAGKKVEVKVRDPNSYKDIVLTFEDYETMDYFFEKFKKAIANRRPLLRKKMDSIRLKAIMIERQLNKVIEKQK